MSVKIEAEQSPVLHMKVLNRAHELPLVKSAATYVVTFYQQAKDYSPLLNSTLNMAENGAKVAGRAATPVVTRLDGNINKVDDIACQVLNALENKYPCIRMETDEVSTYLVNTTAEVRGGAEKYAGALLQSTPGQLALMGLAGYLRVANKVADITLPQDKSVSTRSFESSNLALLDVARLSDQLYCRICRHSTVQLQLLQETSTKALIGLQSHLTALELAAKANLEKYGIKDQSEKLWQQLQSTTNSVHEQALVAAGQFSQHLRDGTSAVTERTLQLAHQISLHLVSAYAAAAKSSSNLPAAVQSALQKSQWHADKLYMQLSQVKSTDDLTVIVLSQIRETMILFQSSISYILQTASNLPLVKNAPAAVSNAVERLQSYVKPVQQNEMSCMADL